MARPKGSGVIYGPEVRQAVLDRLANGESLHAISKDEGMPSVSHVLRWQDEDAEFAEKYTRARRIGIDALAEKAVAVSSDESLDANSRRVQLDAIKWFTSKLRPDKYGDRIAQEISGPGGGPVETKITLVAVEPKPND